MIKASVYQKNTVFVNIWAPKIGALNIQKIFTELKEEIESNTVIVGSFQNESGKSRAWSPQGQQEVEVSPALHTEVH